MYREICGFVEKRDGPKVLTRTVENDFYRDTEIDLTDVEHEFDMMAGDRINVYIECTDPPKVYRIEPLQPLENHMGRITNLTRSFGVVDDEYVFFVQKKMDKWLPRLGDNVQCMLIEGEYRVGRNNFQLRCESIQKADQNEADQTLFNHTNDSINRDDIADSENEDTNDSQMRLYCAVDSEPRNLWYDLPFGLYEVLQTKKAPKIKKMLDSFVPNKLVYSTYRSWFHALTYLEEVEMKASFERYKSDEIWITQENNRHAIICTRIKQLRPPIAIGEFEQKKKNYQKNPVNQIKNAHFIVKIKTHLFHLISI